MCKRYLCRLLCGHIDQQYQFCEQAKLRPDWDYFRPQDWFFPCDNITSDPGPPRDSASECRFPGGCPFEARGRSWACCRCGSRPNTAGYCRGLSDACKHVCCMTCENYVGKSFFPDTWEKALKEGRRRQKAREKKERSQSRHRHRHSHHHS